MQGVLALTDHPILPGKGLTDNQKPVVSDDPEVKRV